MFNYFRNKLETARLKARYERLVQERVLNLIEKSGPQPVAEDPGNWTLLGSGKSSLGESERTDARTKARKLVVDNPYARNLLRLLEIYVVGPELKLIHTPLQKGGDLNNLDQEANRLWSRFLEENRTHFSYREFARRTWRDGECFLRTFPASEWPPAVRFVDPETIGPTSDHPDSHGILTDPDDVETPISYLRIDLASGELKEEIPAEEIIHTKIGVDSNQKRGLTIFTPVLSMLSSFDEWLDIELQARKLQASIVLWRKVQGSPSQVASIADAAQTSTVNDPLGTARKERYRPGSILTTSQATELEFLQPNTNFSDAVPLGRLLLLSTAAGAGVPEFMLTSDASNANFASTMVAEGPAVKLFESEQYFFTREFSALWRWVMSEAVRQRLLPEDFFERMTLSWSFPQLINRDRPREKFADVQLVKQKVLSRAEVARRDNADPILMQKEIEQETAQSGNNSTSNDMDA
ncbi:MAG: phage portal protein [Planctomycetes bacterium]|nr:phage portal protein [Planctomycetota bacterium]